jgi:phosphatidylinositol-3-phosphatase
LRLSTRNWKLALAVIPLFVVLTACGTAQQATRDAPKLLCAPPPASYYPASLPSVQVKHVFIVVLENHSYDDVIGNTQDMPYLNGLAGKYSKAAGYFADTHPSMGNYFMLTTGQIIEGFDSFSGTVTADNVVRELIDAGKTWKEYSEALPSAGYDGGDVGYYLQHHDPLSYFSDVRDNPSQKANLVPFSQLAVDIAAHTLPDYGFIVPDTIHDAHNCPNGDASGCTVHQKLVATDAWLQTNVDPLIQSADFNVPGGGLLIITFDESFESDTVMGGGHVAWVVVGPDVRKGFTSGYCYQHPSTLRFMSEMIGIQSYPAGAATAPSMREFIVGDN